MINTNPQVQPAAGLRRHWLLLGGLCALAVALLYAWQAPVTRADEELDQAALAQAHQGHHAPPPTKGSEVYQFTFPSRNRVREDQVINPTPPAPVSRKVHEYELVVEEDLLHEVAPGIRIPAWTFNGHVPGPVIRAREGELVRVKLINKGTVPHTLHFHGTHAAEMDGVFQLVPPGGTFTYEFIAQPYGVFPYHCHANPASKHVHNGLYGMMIVDPKQGRAPMKELAMVMSAFDLDRDGDADFYAWNGKAFQYADHPVDLNLGEPVRMYVLNIFEEMMAPHIHGNMFGLIRTGTALQPREVADVVSLAIAERAILEFKYDLPGAYMFQCHFSEHMELGLMGWFRVGDAAAKKADGKVPPAASPHVHKAGN
jgi:FtsP/CotA-like multicopper oxidase with cupredoxin domain